MNKSTCRILQHVAQNNATIAAMRIKKPSNKFIAAFSDFTTAYNALSPPLQLREKPAKLDAQCDVLLRYARFNLPTSKLSDHLCVNMSAFLNFTARDHAIKGDHLPLVITLISLC
ncbi:MAG: hypothetical protein ACRCYJ_10985 [Plesiomonas shigelloides]